MYDRKPCSKPNDQQYYANIGPHMCSVWVKGVTQFDVGDQLLHVFLLLYLVSYPNAYACMYSDVLISKDIPGFVFQPHSCYADSGEN
jgi:hypothetical protein